LQLNVPVPSVFRNPSGGTACQKYRLIRFNGSAGSGSLVRSQLRVKPTQSWPHEVVDAYNPRGDRTSRLLPVPDFDAPDFERL